MLGLAFQFRFGSVFPRSAVLPGPTCTIAAADAVSRLTIRTRQLVPALSHRRVQKVETEGSPYRLCV